LLLVFAVLGDGDELVGDGAKVGDFVVEATVVLLGLLCPKEEVVVRGLEAMSFGLQSLDFALVAVAAVLVLQAELVDVVLFLLEVALGAVSEVVEIPPEAVPVRDDFHVLLARGREALARLLDDFVPYPLRLALDRQMHGLSHALTHGLGAGRRRDSALGRLGGLSGLAPRREVAVTLCRHESPAERLDRRVEALSLRQRRRRRRLRRAKSLPQRSHL